MWMGMVAVHAQTTSEPPTIDPGPILLLVVVVAIAYFIVSHIKEILTFVAVVAAVLMVLGVLYLRDTLTSASVVSPSVELVRQGGSDPRVGLA